MASPASVRILSLCAGVGGLDLGLAAALNYCGRVARCVCHVEREASAAAILAARMAEGSLDAAPVWSDLRTFDGRPWRGVVDCVTAGYPCQPFSCAGLRLGETDPRHLWPEVDRILGETDAPLVLLENVAAHLRMGFSTVRRDLKARGYRVQAGIFSAAEVGASHRRERLFILAHRPGAGRREGVTLHEPAGRDAHADAGRRRSTLADAEHANGRPRVLSGGSCRKGGNRPGQAASKPGIGHEALADARCRRDEAHEPLSIPRRDGAAGIGHPRGDLAHAEHGGLQAERALATQTRQPDVADVGLPLFAPGPGAVQWRDILAWGPALAPAVEPGLRVLVDGLAVVLDAARANQLRASGNGVVALCAAHAFITLAREAGLIR